MPKTLTFILWLLPAVLESVIVVAMHYRKLWRDFPIFFSYLIFEIGRVVFLFPERNNPWIYFYGYWITEALGCLAAIWVIKELFDHVFSEYLGLRRLGNILFQCSILILLVTMVFFAFASPSTERNRLMAEIFVLKRTVTFVQFGLLAFLFLFVVAFGFGWQHYTIGIALGFFIYEAVEASAVLVRMRYGHMAQVVYNFVMMTVNNCCVLVWAVYFLKPVHEKIQQAEFTDHKRLLDEWNEGLLQVLKR